MNKTRAVAVLILLGMLFGGCASIDAKRKFAEGAGIYTKTIIPEYKEYVDKDPNLEQDSKRIRKQTADEFQSYIEKGIK